MCFLFILRKAVPLMQSDEGFLDKFRHHQSAYDPDDHSDSHSCFSPFAPIFLSPRYRAICL